MTDYLLEKRFDDRDTAEDAATQFIDFCKGRAWVLTDVGADTYGFTHRTFLEYFAASPARQERIQAPKRFSLFCFPLFEAGTAEIVPQLAVQILGRSVEDGADDFLELCVGRARSPSVAGRRQLSSFSARALEFVVPRPSVLRGTSPAAW